jgi:hypothetical protein
MSPVGAIHFFWRGCRVAPGATLLAREEDDEKVRLRFNYMHFVCHFELFSNKLKYIM